MKNPKNGERNVERRTRSTTGVDVRSARETEAFEEERLAPLPWGGRALDMSLPV